MMRKALVSQGLSMQTLPLASMAGQELIWRCIESSYPCPTPAPVPQPSFYSSPCPQFSHYKKASLKFSSYCVLPQPPFKILNHAPALSSDFDPDFVPKLSPR